MRAVGELEQLGQRLQMLEAEVEVLSSVLQDLQLGGPARPAPTAGQPPASAPDAGQPPASAPDGGLTPAGPAGSPLAGAAPADGPAVVEPFFACLTDFVEHGFAPVYCRPTGPAVRWCARWWEHAEALYRFEALWRTWELARLDPRLGIASWLRDHLDPQLHQLTSPTGPFAQCTEDRHAAVRPLPTQSAPVGYFTA